MEFHLEQATVPRYYHVITLLIYLGSLLSVVTGLRRNRRESKKHNEEVDVITHQRNLLIQALKRIEDLKCKIEEQRAKYEKKIESLQKQLKEPNSEILEKRLELLKTQLQQALTRAEDAEQKSLTNTLPPTLPPPPPPLPPPIFLSEQFPVLHLQRKTCRDINEIKPAVELTPEKKCSTHGVNEDIINAIKKGKFTLKKPRKENSNGNSEREKQSPTPDSELLIILGSLRKAPKKRPSQHIGDAHQ